MDCKDELIKRPLLPIKNFKDELEHECEQPLLCTKLYLRKSAFQSLQIFAFVYPTPASAVLFLAFLHDSSIITQRKVFLGIFYVAITILTMFKQISLTMEQWDRTFKYLIEEEDIKCDDVSRPLDEIVISYSPPSSQRGCSSQSCLITWAYFLAFLVLITSLCREDGENMKGFCTLMDPQNTYFSMFLCLFWGMSPSMLSGIRLSSRCDEAERELLRNVNTETDKLVILCNKRSEIKRDERIDSIDVLVFTEKKCNACNAGRTKLRKDQQTKDLKEESIADVESDQTHINGQNKQLEASTQINKTVEDELRGLHSKYYDLQVKYDSLLHILACDNDREAPPVLEY